MTEKSNLTKKRAAVKKGRLAENLACMMLMARGFRIVARHYQPRHRGIGAGEIDIIARRRRLVVFIEVKSRAAGEVREALSPEQCRRIMRSAEIFLAQMPDAQRPDAHKLTVRFDAVFFGRNFWPHYVANAWQEE